MLCFELQWRQAINSADSLPKDAGSPQERREQILSMGCFGKSPYWVHLVQGKHKTEEIDRMTSWLTSSTLLVLSSLIKFQQLHVRDDPNCGDFSAPRENRQRSLHWGHTGCPDLSEALSTALTSRLPHPHLNNENGMVLYFQSWLSQGKCNRIANTAAKLYKLSLENR